MPRASNPNLKQEELDEMFYASRHGSWEAEGLKHRLRTICEVCRREGAEDHYDTHGIYAGRWHTRCAGPTQISKENYHWQPGDEPLEEDD